MVRTKMSSHGPHGPGVSNAGEEPREELEVEGFDEEEVERINKELEDHRKAVMQKAREKKRIEDAEKKRVEVEKAKEAAEVEKQRLAKIAEDKAAEVEKQRLAKIAEDKAAEDKKRLEDLAIRERQKKRKKDGEIRNDKVAKKMKEKQQVEVDSDYDPDVEDDDDEDGEGKKGPKKKQAKLELTQSEIIDAFLKYEFIGTAYPDKDTTKALGIHNDYLTVMNYCGLDGYVTKRENTYPEAAAEFLATVKYHVVPGKKHLETMGGGQIIYTVFGEEYTTTLKEMDKIFGFPLGNPNPMCIDKKQYDKVWKFLSGGAKFKGGSKCGTRIRSPVFAYARKVIAETFFSRSKTGPASKGDLDILTIGLQKALEDNPIDGEAIVWNTKGAGLAFVLAKHLETYRGKLTGNIAKGVTSTPNCIGGPITAIMRGTGVTGIDWTAEIDDDKYKPRVMDIEYLRAQTMLAPTKYGSDLLYTFQLNGKEVLIELPHDELTAINDHTNIEFQPHEEFWFEPIIMDEHVDLPSTERPSASNSGLKKKVTPVTKAKKKSVVPSLTKEQLECLEMSLHDTLLTPTIIETLLPPLIAKLTPILVESLTPLLVAQLKRKRVEDSDSETDTDSDSESETETEIARVPTSTPVPQQVHFTAPTMGPPTGPSRASGSLTGAVPPKKKPKVRVNTSGHRAT